MTRSRALLLVGGAFLLLLTSLPGTACTAPPGRNGTTGTETGAGAAPADGKAGVPVVPIGSRYRMLTVYEVLPVEEERADYSGVTVIEADSSGVTLWLADDKAVRMERSIYEARLDLPRVPRTGVVALRPAPVPVTNAHGIPTGDDIEDIGWIPAAGGAPALLAAVGERGPKDAPVSWMYFLVPGEEGLRLSRSGSASPPGEEVGNDGMEGLAVRRLEGGAVDLYLFKERPAPVYARRFRLEPDSSGYRLSTTPPDTTFEMTRQMTQSGAAFSPGGDRLYVVDRQARRIAVYEVPRGDTPIAADPIEWIDFTGIDASLEGRDADTPPSLFGVTEAVALDSAGRLYLLADNNEVRHSRLVVLEKIQP